MARCPWAAGPNENRAYHDAEWGVPLHDDRALFEFLVLEGAQAGLSLAPLSLSMFGVALLAGRKAGNRRPSYIVLTGFALALRTKQAGFRTCAARA